MGRILEVELITPNRCPALSFLLRDPVQCEEFARDDSNHRSFLDLGCQLLGPEDRR